VRSRPDSIRSLRPGFAVVPGVGVCEGGEAEKENVTTGGAWSRPGTPSMGDFYRVTCREERGGERERIKGNKRRMGG